MKTLLLFLSAVLLSASYVYAEQDLHKDIDERLMVLRLGTSYEKMEVLRYFAAFRDMETFTKRGIEQKLLDVFINSNEAAQVRASAASAIKSLVEVRMIEKFASSEPISRIVSDAKENLLVRVAGVKALGTYMKLFPRETRIELYTKSLRDLLKLPTSKNALKVEVLQTLCSLGDEAAQDALKFALADRDLIDMAVASLWNLLSSGGKIVDVIIAIRLLDVFCDDQLAAPTRIRAGECLCFLVKNGLTGTFTLKPVTDLLENRATDARLIPTACKILHTLKNQKSVAPIVDRLDDDTLDDEVRIAMINILADFFRDLIPGTDTTRAVNNALSTFARILRTRDPIDRKLFKYSVALRRVCCFATGMVQPGFSRRGAVLILIGALEDIDESVRANASAGLIEITNQNFGEKTEAWQKWFEKYSNTIN